MIRRLGEVRVDAPPLLLLALISALATVAIISSGAGHTPAQLAALAALRTGGHVETTGPGAPGARGAGSPATAASADAPAVAAGTAAASVGATANAGSTGRSTGPSTSATAGSHTSPATTGAAPSPSGKTSSTTGKLPKVDHVFELALSTTSFAAAFGKASAAPYLRSLETKGTFLSEDESLRSSELADYLAMVSGQGPNADTSAGCTTYAEFPTGTAAARDGLVPGTGCIYPETALTIGDQVTASGHVWKAYIADMGNQTCAHPNSNAATDTALPGTEPGYDLAHNPFVYFHSLLDLGDCANDDQDLSRLESALHRGASTARFSFIAPAACDDAAAIASQPPGGSTTASSTTSTTSTTTTSATSTTSTTTSPTETTTTPSDTGPSIPATSGCPPGDPVGIAAEDAFLRQWVPKILASPAYRADGVLVIAFAATGPQAGPGLVRTGALVLSRYAAKGKTIATRYGPYSLLRSIEDMLGYAPLGHAKSAPSFAAAVLHRSR